MARAKDDMSWAEVGKLSTTYLKIPFALLCVEAFYWFLTQPSNTLAPIQVTEAWTWHMLTELIYGAGSSSLGYEGGWLTKVTLYHPDFYPYAGVSAISLYVSDECAGIHEMIFISTLVMMTDGVSQRMRLKTCAVMCAIIAHAHEISHLSSSSCVLYTKDSDPESRKKRGAIASKQACIYYIQQGGPPSKPYHNTNTHNTYVHRPQFTSSCILSPFVRRCVCTELCLLARVAIA